MTPQALLVLIAVFFVACSGFTAFIASEKGYNAVIGLWGLILGPLGLLFAIGLPDKYARPTQKP